MINVYCDESHDGTTYALAGWLASPTGWDGITPAWKEMLGRFKYGNGEPVKAFHAVDIVERDKISDSPFKGWSFDDEKSIFGAACDVVIDRRRCGNLWPLGVSISIPADASTWLGGPTAAEQDSMIWFLLFARLFMIVLDEYPPQQGFSFMFDNKPRMKKIVNDHYDNAKALVDEIQPGKLDGDVIAFGSDEQIPPLQIADLLAYEWRKRISDRVKTPDKAPRMSWKRIRDGRSDNARLRHYNQAAMRAMRGAATSGAFFRVMMAYPTTED